MNTQKKTDLAADTQRLCLHKEGIFYKLYNQHAMLFTENIKPLKIKAAYVKIVGQYVCSCGFPNSILDEMKQRLGEHGGVLEESGKLITVTGVNWDKEPDYGLWHEQHLQQTEGGSTGSGPGLTDIEKKIAAFLVMRKTPLRRGFL